MKRATSELAEPIDRRFLRRLEAFARDGYRFNDDHALKPGTQYEAFDGYLQGIREGYRQGYYEIPTGVGKTAIFTSLIKNYLDAANGHADGKRVLVVVPSVVLVKQTANAFAKFLPEIAPRLKADDDSGHPIDWDNSQIGVQYQKVKHADRKPSVLITTYASLIRDKHNKIYDPKEFGLVVYDEGHTITAKEASKAVSKFGEAYQLAVTATPDYSKDKQVRHQLSHCYYRLPLAEAINRRDLCGVRPILIKTNYTVDVKKVEEFIKSNNGQPLSDTQLQHLFNVEARNRVVIDTYLADRDPDSGDRFLGQNGLIFSGGIQHAEDMVRQFNEALGERRFSKIRRWLQDENLEIAAAVHSRAKGAWLRPGLLLGSDATPLPDRIREGKREWYSEDEVRQLHEQGKILLLISDKKLREGYDCPRDSIVIDMVDRLSVVDVTQRFGRGFRLDPDDPNKVCTPINLVDANTHEIYKNRPQMLPIYAAEILEGAEFRKPMKRQLLNRFKHEIPEADKALNHGKFEVISDPQVIRQFNHKQRRPVKAPEARPGWMSGSAIQVEYGGGHTALIASIVALREEKLKEFRAEGVNETQALKEVDDKWVQWATARNGDETWHVSPAGLEELIRTGKVRTNRPPEAKPGWMSGGAIARQYGGTGPLHIASIQALGAAKQAELRVAGIEEGDAKREVEDKWVQWARRGAQAAWYVSPEGLEELIRAGKVSTERTPEAMPGWMSANAIRKKYGGTPSSYNESIAALREEKLKEYSAAGMDEARAQQEVDNEWVRWAKAGKRGVGSWHISPEGLEELIRTGKVHTNRTPEAKPGWMSGNAIRKEYGGGYETLGPSIAALREEKLKEFRAEGMDEVRAQQEVDGKWVQWASTKGKEGWHVSPEGLRELIRTGKVRTESAPEAKPGWLTGSAIMMAHGGKRDSHNASISALREKKLKEFKAEGMDDVRAQQEVDDKWVQWAVSGNGKRAWYISREGLDELIHTGMMPIDRQSRQNGTLTPNRDPNKHNYTTKDNDWSDGAWTERTGQRPIEPGNLHCRVEE